MRRLFVPASFTLAILALAAPACFPDFAITDAASDGGTSGGDGSASSSGGGGSGGGGSGSGSGGSGSGSGSGSTGFDGAAPGDGAIPTLPDGAPVTGDGGSTPYNPATQVIVPHGTFTFTDWTSQGNTTVTLTNDVLFDKYEVTTAAFNAWINGGKQFPQADGESLDPGGPYAQAMYWQAAWDNYVADLSYNNPNCNDADALEANGESNDSPTFAPTYPMYLASDGGGSPAKYPINCVNFYQAVAYCWSVGKRLPTEAEWQYEITGRGRGYTYPWGNAPSPTDCSHAIWRGDGGATNNYDGCGWPTPIGSAPQGFSLDGVFDMQGSVEEWVWNQPNNEFPPLWPNNYAGPNEDAGVDLPRTARGGSYYTEAANMDGKLYDDLGGPDETEKADLGFRCVKSRL